MQDRTNLKILTIALVLVISNFEKYSNPSHFIVVKRLTTQQKNIDILPNLLDFAEISLEVELAGKNLLENKHRGASFCVLQKDEGEAAFMWRSNQYKLIVVLIRKIEAADYLAEDILAGEFYNLKEDPNEWYDLYDEKEIEPIKQEFTFKLLQHLKSM